VRVAYDAVADAAYIYLRDIEAGGVHSVTPVLDDDDNPLWIHLDFADGRLIGIEIPGARDRLPPSLVEDAEKLG
jgi:uncharacterized protein YuzE